MIIWADCEYRFSKNTNVVDDGAGMEKVGDCEWDGWFASFCRLSFFIGFRFLNKKPMVCMVPQIICFAAEFETQIFDNFLWYEKISNSIALHQKPLWKCWSDGILNSSSSFINLIKTHFGTSWTTPTCSDDQTLSDYQIQIWIRYFCCQKVWPTNMCFSSDVQGFVEKQEIRRWSMISS